MTGQGHQPIGRGREAWPLQWMTGSSRPSLQFSSQNQAERRGGLLRRTFDGNENRVMASPFQVQNHAFPPISARAMRLAAERIDKIERNRARPRGDALGG